MPKIPHLLKVLGRGLCLPSHPPRPGAASKRWLCPPCPARQSLCLLSWVCAGSRQRPHVLTQALVPADKQPLNRDSVFSATLLSTDIRAAHCQRCSCPCVFPERGCGDPSAPPLAQPSAARALGGDPRVIPSLSRFMLGSGKGSAGLGWDLRKRLKGEKMIYAHDDGAGGGVSG